MPEQSKPRHYTLACSCQAPLLHGLVPLMPLVMRSRGHWWSVTMRCGSHWWFVAVRRRRARRLVVVDVLVAIRRTSDGDGCRLSHGAIRIEDAQTLRVLIPRPGSDKDHLAW